MMPPGVIRSSAYCRFIITLCYGPRLLPSASATARWQTHLADGGQHQHQEGKKYMYRTNRRYHERGGKITNQARTASNVSRKETPQMWQMRSQTMLTRFMSCSVRQACGETIGGGKSMVWIFKYSNKPASADCVCIFGGIFTMGLAMRKRGEGGAVIEATDTDRGATLAYGYPHTDTHDFCGTSRARRATQACLMTEHHVFGFFFSSPGGRPLKKRSNLGNGFLCLCMSVYAFVWSYELSLALCGGSSSGRRFGDQILSDATPNTEYLLTKPTYCGCEGRWNIASF